MGFPCTRLMYVLAYHADRAFLTGVAHRHYAAEDALQIERFGVDVICIEVGGDYQRQSAAGTGVYQLEHQAEVACGVLRAAEVVNGQQLHGLDLAE